MSADLVGVPGFDGTEFGFLLLAGGLLIFCSALHLSS